MKEPLASKLDMSLPTSPVDRNLPKGPNFLGIVIGFAVAILVILFAAWMLVGYYSKHKAKSRDTSVPSQTRVVLPAPGQKTLA